MKKIIYILSFLSISFISKATNHYFSNVGNDVTGNGTIGNPYATITKLNSIFSTFSTGDSILFRRGDSFYGGIIVNKSGASGNPIVISSYGTGINAVITGFTNVISFTNISSNIWESSSPISTLSVCNMVTIGSVSYAMGRSPNTGFYTYQSFLGATSITSSNLNSSVINWTGAQAVIKKFRYVFTKPTITSASGSTINFANDGYNGQANWGFFIQNDIRTLDQQNEWYYNPTTKKIDVYSTTTPTNVQVSTIDALVTATNVSYITFDGINFTGANVEAFYTGNFANCKIQNCNFDFNYNAFQGAQFGGSSANLLVNNCTFNHTNNDCIDFSTEFTTPTITNNLIKNTASFEGMMSAGQSGWAMNVTTSNALIQYNEVDTSGYIGIGFNCTNSSPNTVKNNYVNYFCYLKDDGGGIYSGNAQVSQIIDSNIVVNGIGNNAGINSTALRASAIYCDDNSSGFSIRHNSLGNISYTGVFLHNANNNTVTYNTIYACGLGELIDNDNSGTFTTNIYSHQNKIIAQTTGANFSTQDQRTIDAATAHTSGNDIRNFGDIDSNYYARPIDDNLTIRYTIYGVADADASLAQWQTYSLFDTHSHKSPASISNVNQLFFAYNPNSYDSTVTIPAGTWIDVTGAGFATSTILHAYSSIVLISTGSLITPTISWTPLTPITYGTALGAAELNATSGGVTGTFAYTPGSGTVLNAGTQNLSTAFTPSDPLTYTTASKTVSITVNQETATLSYPSLSATYTGSPLPISVLTSPSGLTGVSTLYNGVSQIPTNANSYSVVSGLNNPNYTASTISGTYIISPLAGTFTASNQTFQYDSLLHTITVTTSDPRITYTLSNSPQRYKGVYSFTIHNTNTNFNVPDLTVTLTITAGVAPPLSWSPANMTYPAAIGASQTNATDSKTGTYNYTPTTGFVPSAGSLQLSVDFTPSDTNLAPIIGTTRTITVAKRTDVITVIDTIQYADGTSKTIHPTTLYGGTLTITGGTGTAVGDYPYTITYSDPNNQASPVSGTLHILSNAATIYMTNYQNLVYTGSPLSPMVNCPYSYSLSFSPSNHTNVNASIEVIATINDGIHTGADTVFMNIIKATPIGTWAVISPVSYIYTVQSGILNASTATAGTWAYNVNVGDTLVPGTYNLLGTFTPTDATDYNSITLSNSILVNKGSATISITNTSKQYNTQVQYATVTTTPPNLDSLVVTYTGNHQDVGSYPITAQLFSNLYTAPTVTGTLTISQVNYTLSWATPAPIQQGTALNYALPTSSIAGTFTYNYPIGYIAQNNLTLIATFHPTDNNYPVQAISVFQSVYGNPVQNHYIKHGKTIYLNYPAQ